MSGHDPYRPRQAPAPIAGSAAPQGVPDGSAATVLAWVDAPNGERHQRAAAALVAEQAKPRPRATLVAALERILGGR